MKLPKEFKESALPVLVKMIQRPSFSWDEIKEAVEMAVPKLADERARSMAINEAFRPGNKDTLSVFARYFANTHIRLAEIKYSPSLKMFHLPTFNAWLPSWGGIGSGWGWEFSCPVPERGKIYADEVTYCGWCNAFAHGDSDGDSEFVNKIFHLPFHGHSGMGQFHTDGEELFKEIVAAGLPAFRPLGKKCSPACDRICGEKHRELIEYEQRQEAAKRQAERDEEFEQRKLIYEAKRATRRRAQISARPISGESRRLFCAISATAELANL